MDYAKIAEQVVHYVGGRENISHFEHCSTRLRFTLIDDGKVNIQELERVEGVIGVRQNVQTQIIIGNEVNEVYVEVKKILGELSQVSASQKNSKTRLGARFLDFLVSVFQPLIPAIAGGGVLKSLLLLLALFGWLNKEAPTFKILTFIGDAPLYFLPLLVAVTTAKKLKVNELVALSAVGAMLLPNFVTMMTEGTTLFRLEIQNISYAYQVFPAILTVIFYGVMERFFTRYTPKPIRIFFVPMMSLVITVPIALLFLGPIGFNFGQLFSSVILFLFEKLGWVATGLLAVVLPFMVATGMHKAMLPYAVTTMSKLGKEILYLPTSLAHNISESGAAFAVAFRTKDEKLRATAISSGISALFGITEPALYGVTLQHKTVLYSVIFGSLMGGVYVGLTGVEAFALVGPGLASMTMYTDPDNPQNLVNAFIGFAISFVVAFIAAFVMFKDKEDSVVDDTSISETNDHYNEEKISFKGSVEGVYVPLSKVEDDVFSSKLVGEGHAIYPTSGKLYAPVAGTVEMVYESKHALALKAVNGAEILFHVGLNTVNLKGKYFNPKVTVGDIVNVGDELMQFDLESLKAEGFDPTVIQVVTNKDEFDFDIVDTLTEITLQSETMRVIRKG